MADHRFHGIEERFPQPHGDISGPALHNSANGIANIHRVLNGSINILAPAGFNQPGVNLHLRNHLFGNHPGSNQRQREPPGEMATAAGIVVAAKLVLGHPVGMAWPGSIHNVLVIGRLHILILKNDG